MTCSTNDPDAGLLDLEHDLPTSEEDVRALRRVRHLPSTDLLQHPERLVTPFAPPDALRSRPTFAGSEPFELA